MKQKSDPVKSAKTKAWKAISLFVRARDPQCVSCGRPTTEAGHYQHNTDKPSKQSGGNMLWYDLRNINGQCGVCNRWKSGNLAPYALYLQRKYGNDILRELNILYLTPKKWTIEEILAITQKLPEGS